jgi:protein subunit release factor A
MMEKRLLFSLTKKDFEIQTFRAGGKGGQYQNKTESGVRIIHQASGAVGEARDGRSQSDNKANAFRRMVESKKFKIWHKMEVARRLGQIQDIEAAVAKAMQPENLLIEIKEDGKWVKGAGDSTEED